MPRKRILIAESRGFPPAAYDALSQEAEVELADLDRPGLEAAVARANILWVRLRHRLDAPLLDRAPALEMIATPTTGLTHIDLEAVAERGIRIVSLGGETGFLNGVRATAEHTIGLILSLLRHIPEAVAHVNGGGWNRDLFQGSEIYNRTAGVVGYGRLGRIVARYLRAFDARVLAADPNASGCEPGVELVPLAELLRASDIVTLHVNLCPATRGFFGRREFELMKPGSYLINTSRGELLDESALVGALRSGRLAGAAVDVVSGEHTGTSPLVGVPNLLVTPHIGGCTLESMQKTELFLSEKVLNHLRCETGDRFASAAGADLRALHL